MKQPTSEPPCPHSQLYRSPGGEGHVHGMAMLHRKQWSLKPLGVPWPGMSLAGLCLQHKAATVQMQKPLSSQSLGFLICGGR